MNIIIAGVGGQGTLLASRVLGQYATMKGFDCKLSEVHGMAQRGGSVVTYVKMADQVYSPIVGDGDADLLIAFEQLEALRWAHAVRPGGDIVMNTQEIMPLPVITGAAEYPADAAARVRARDVRLHALDALKIALGCGSAKAVNTVMLGAAAKVAGFDIATMRQALAASVKEKFLALNEQALARGYEL